VFGARARDTVTEGGVDPAPGATRWLLLDTLAYVNLGLLDGALSKHVFEEGGFALLQYGYLFINAALAVPSAAATVVALRIAGARRDDAHARLRAWALLAGAVVAGCVVLVWAALAWAPIAAIVDRGAGWGLSEAIRPIVLCAVPFAALRLTNTVGRQLLVAQDPRKLFAYDATGLFGRALVLVFGTAAWGVLASPIGLAVAEIVQVAAWIRAPRQRKASA